MMTTTTNSVFSLDPAEPRCCWCGGEFEFEDAPLVFPAGRIAWCAETEACRDRQRACAISREVDGEEQWLFVPTPKGTEVCEATEPNVFVVGNRGGGKSHNIRWMCHALAMAVPGFKYAILRTSFPELMKNHLDFLEDEKDKLGGEKEGFKYNKTDHVFRYPNGSVGYYAQCATDADVKKILGAEVALVVFDEAPTFQWDHMRLIAASIRVPAGSGMKPMTRYLGNPIGESIDDLWSYFVDKDVDLKKDPEYRPNDWRTIEMSIQDNPYLDAKEYWKQFSGLPEHFIKAWREGVRVEENTLFSFYPKIDGKPYHVVNEPPQFSNGEPLFRVRNGRYFFPDWVQIFRAYDHGFYPDPAVMLWFAVYGRRILCFKEKTWFRVLSEDIAEQVVRDSRGMRVTDTFCDPSIDIRDGHDVFTTKQKMEAKGLPMTCSVNNREFFADAIHSGLDEKVSPSTPRIQFLQSGTYGAGCPMTIKWLPRMKWSEKNPAALAEHKYDHWIVALAYFLMSHIPDTKPGKTTKLRRWQIPKNRRQSAMSRIMLRRLDREEREQVRAWNEDDDDDL
jgi:hypothetical protein